MTSDSTATNATAEALGANLSAPKPETAREFGIVYSNASEATGGLVTAGFTLASKSRSAAKRVIKAQPGIEAVFVTLTENGWVDADGRTPQQIIDPAWKEPRDHQARVGGHLSRSFAGPDQFTADCPCPVAPCGFAMVSPVNCPQHSPSAAKTIRSWHAATECTGSQS
jgi:hypothetical protein